MPKGTLDLLQILHWNEARELIKPVNQKLVEIIDKFNPGKDFVFIKARYQYGDKILKRGELQLPTATGTVPFQHHTIPAEIRKKLNYSTMPMGIILSKSIEVFFENEERTMPSKLFSTGTLFGLWEAFDPEPSEFVKKVWNLSAGARTVFMLPKISDAISHNRLKRDYGIHTHPPKKLLDHHKIFADLARKQQEDNWYCDILFFSDKWLENKDDNFGYLKLHKYWLSEAWKQSFNCRNQMSYDVAWEDFAREIGRRNYKPGAYIINVIKHLLTIGEGIFPGFTPAIENNEDALPVNLIQEAYRKSYLLKHYEPIIMQPCHLREKGEIAYYSLSLPTQLEYVHQAKSSSSIMTDMRELKTLMLILLESVKNKTADFDFFHSEKDQFNEIRNASEIPDEDPRFLFKKNKDDNPWFCDNSPFWRGCVRIKLLESKTHSS